MSLPAITPSTVVAQPPAISRLHVRLISYPAQDVASFNKPEPKGSSTPWLSVAQARAEPRGFENLAESLAAYSHDLPSSQSITLCASLLDDAGAFLSDEHTSIPSGASELLHRPITVEKIRYSLGKWIRRWETWCLGGTTDSISSSGPVTSLTRHMNTRTGDKPGSISPMRVPRVVWVNQPHAASVPDEPWVAPNPDDSRAILVAEDNLINCMLLAKMLHRLGANFKLAQNGEEAFEEYKRHPERYWCVFMDLSMPVADGYTSSRWIRQFERENRLQRCVMVLMYVGEPDIGPRTDVFDYFLEKPFRQCWIQGILDAEREREMRSVASDGFSRGGSV